jgi:hypothetical protein
VSKKVFAASNGDEVFQQRPPEDEPMNARRLLYRTMLETQGSQCDSGTGQKRIVFKWSVTCRGGALPAVKTIDCLFYGYEYAACHL